MWVCDARGARVNPKFKAVPNGVCSPCNSALQKTVPWPLESGMHRAGSREGAEEALWRQRRREPAIEHCVCGAVELLKSNGLCLPSRGVQSLCWIQQSILEGIRSSAVPATGSDPGGFPAEF